MRYFNLDGPAVLTAADDPFPSARPLADLVSVYLDTEGLSLLPNERTLRSFVEEGDVLYSSADRSRGTFLEHYADELPDVFPSYGKLYVRWYDGVSSYDHFIRVTPGRGPRRRARRAAGVRNPARADRATHALNRPRDA